MTTYPEFTTKHVQVSHRCRMGYAPSDNGDNGCMFCDHPVRATCHLDYGAPDIIHDSRKNGKRLRVRYAHQTVVYRGWGWLDLVAMRRQLEDALAVDNETVRRTVVSVINYLPER